MKTVGTKKGWYWPQNPNNVAGWDGTWASSGKLNFYAPNRGTRSDSTMRLTEAVVLPEHASCASAMATRSTRTPSAATTGASSRSR